MSEQRFSEPVNWVRQPRLGFVINAEFSEENTRLIVEWLEGLRAVVPEGIYVMPAEALHITVLDWVAPLMDYEGQDKRVLFESARETNHRVFKSITDSLTAFAVTFDTVKVTPGTVIVTGQDQGQFQNLRQRFVEAAPLPKGAKAPPTIIHSSLARFVPPAVDMAPAEAYAASHPLRFTQPIEEFRLVETRREPMLDFEVLERYTLRNRADA